MTQLAIRRSATERLRATVSERAIARRERTSGEAGMVTAELAVAIPAVVLVLALCLAGVTAGIDQIRCVDAARIAARSAARGDTPGAVREVALEAAPSGSTVVVVADGSLVTVTVEARSGGWGGVLPSWELSAQATAPRESSADR
ncbi:TadE family type IV pilus minor pilin [Humibacillus xanthopallidus]|uniref:TadE family type IV pilus minor pilin n=1 Tax=Humibacillus xanthopallidus TaxID=412689 RepID=UPI00384D44BC